MNMMKYVLTVMVSCSVGGLLMGAGCSASRDEEAAAEQTGKSPVVDIAVIEPWQMGMRRRLPGVVLPERRAVLSSRASGTIRTVRVRAGDRVVAGDELAQVESRDLEALVVAAEEQLEAAKSARDQAVRDVDRLERLAHEDLIAHQRVEHARVRLQESEAKVEQADAMLTAQQVNRSYAQIIAPFSGVVAEVVLDEGSFTGPGQPVLILEDRSSLRIDIPVSTEMAQHLSTNQNLFVDPSNLKEPLRVAYVATIPALGDTSAGQVVRLAVEASSSGIQPGEVVEVLLETAGAKGWVALPRTALIQRGQLTGTMVAKRGHSGASLELRWIRLADGDVPEHDEIIAVAQGLEVGEWVVLDPSVDLRAGQRVQTEQVSP